MRAGIASGHEIERRPHVVHFARSVAELAAAGAGAAKVEAQDRASDAAERLRRLVHRLGMHRPAVAGMRMREHDGGAQSGLMSGFEPAIRGYVTPVRRLLDQRFETAGRSGNLTQPDCAQEEDPLTW